MPKNEIKNGFLPLVKKTILITTLSISVFALAASAQQDQSANTTSPGSRLARPVKYSDQQNQQPSSQQSQDDQQQRQQYPDQQPQPYAQGQNNQQNQNNQQSQASQNNAQNNAQYNDQENGNNAIPSSITLPAGTLISVRVNDWLSSDRNQTGDSFGATLSQPIIADGWVIARRGQTVMGRVAVAQKAGRVKGVSKLGLSLDELTLVDGQVFPIHTQLLQSSAGTSNGRDAAAIATTTGVGAAIGAAADDGFGAGIGAAAGAVAGIIGVLATPGRATIIPAETMLTFRLESPVTISTQRSAFVFRPVNQADYSNNAGPGRPRNMDVRPGGYPPPYRSYYSGYGYPYAYPYPYDYYPSSLYFRSYGYGPRFIIRGGHRRR